jgi:hypothetical protein
MHHYFRFRNCANHFLFLVKILHFWNSNVNSCSPLSFSPLPAPRSLLQAHVLASSELKPWHATEGFERRKLVTAEAWQAHLGLKRMKVFLYEVVNLQAT